MECVSTASYSINVNGSLHGFFTDKKGLCQWDPFSPFLFVLCMEYFSRSLRMATEDSDFNFHPKCGSLKIAHLIFVDDLMLFSREDPISMCILMDTLGDFGCKSGLKVNASKSNLFTAGIPDQDLQAILQIANSPKGVMPFRYLGIPLAVQKLRVTHCAPLIDKLRRQKRLGSRLNGVSHQYFGSASIWDRASKKEDPPLIKKMSAIRDSLILSEGSRLAAIQRLSSWVSGGQLSIKAVYDFLRLKGNKICWAKDVWCKAVTLKHAFITWLCAKSKLLTRDKLTFLNINRECGLCGIVE
ncbi:uncharacterized protein LOC127811206 [Diospyros lotus]|uniref:uncharacterized protein LOC127811206 n=1 Tax=Diospyros lotus TaxID=55363 RepID=UPI00225166B2|nr:uncharacterized protein LOC127811206 [Diospyros lotus]